MDVSDSDIVKFALGKVSIERFLELAPHIYGRDDCRRKVQAVLEQIDDESRRKRHVELEASMSKFWDGVQRAMRELAR